MSISGIQGQVLEATVVECHKLKDTEWFSRQAPYVCLEYGSTKFRTRTCTDGGKHPMFQEKFVFTLIEGIREINVVVWNSNTLTYDDFVGSGKIQIQDVLSSGYDDRHWPLQTKTGRYAGEIRLIMDYAYANKEAKSFAPSAPPLPQVPSYGAPPPTTAPSYPPPATANPPPAAAYPPAGYLPVPPYPSSPPYPAYSTYPYPPPCAPSFYPPPQYPPPLAYPPPPYPPPPGHSPPYGPPPGSYTGIYRPPPY